MSNKVALIVGIDYYSHVTSLHGCVNDAHDVAAILKRHADGSVNFDCKLMTASGYGDMIDRVDLKNSIKHLFSSPVEIALFYFAGHGSIESTGGHIIASDVKPGDDGIALNDIIKIAQDSPATNKIIILDSCYSGSAGASTLNADISTLPEGMTILTASTSKQYAAENNGSGVFTSLMVDALNGSAANLLGEITPGSVYAHIDQTLGYWDTQRPVFKTNIQKFVSLRQVQSPISLEDLRLLIEYFPEPGFEYKLDPSYEPELSGREPDAPEPVEENTRVFAKLQKFNRLNLLVPVNAPHMWHAAMGSKTCKLTALGEHYRNLVEKGRLG